jgi:hypothetical protein
MTEPRYFFVSALYSLLLFLSSLQHGIRAWFFVVWFSVVLGSLACFLLVWACCLVCGGCWWLPWHFSVILALPGFGGCCRTKFLPVVLGGSLLILDCSLGLSLCSLTMLVIPGGTRISISALSDRRCSRSLTETLGSLLISPVALDLSRISMVVSDLSVLSRISRSRRFSHFSVVIHAGASHFGHINSFSGRFFSMSAGFVWFTLISAGSCRYIPVFFYFGLVQAGLGPIPHRFHQILEPPATFRLILNQICSL